MRILASTFLAISLLALPAVAQACRVSIPISERLENWYENGLIDTVIVGEVIETQRIDGFPAETGQWIKRLRVIGTPQGQELPGTFVADDGVLISSCGWANNVKSEHGDLVVFYLVRSEEEELETFIAMTFEDAFEVDATIILGDADAAQQP